MTWPQGPGTKTGAIFSSVHRFPALTHHGAVAALGFAPWVALEAVRRHQERELRIYSLASFSTAVARENTDCSVKCEFQLKKRKTTV